MHCYLHLCTVPASRNIIHPLPTHVGLQSRTYAPIQKIIAARSSQLASCSTLPQPTSPNPPQPCTATTRRCAPPWRRLLPYWRLQRPAPGMKNVEGTSLGMFWSAGYVLTYWVPLCGKVEVGGVRGSWGWSCGWEVSRADRRSSICGVRVSGIL